MSTTASSRHEHGTVVLGAEPLPAETLAAAAACDEVFVVSRAVAPAGCWVVDEDVARRAAAERLEHLRRLLEPRGVVVRGIVVEADEHTARMDAAALYPSGAALA